MFALWTCSADILLMWGQEGSWARLGELAVWVPGKSGGIRCCACICVLSADLRSVSSELMYEFRSPDKKGATHRLGDCRCRQ